MPSFRYSATDKAGTSLDGVIDAATADDALLELVNKGLMVNQIMKSFGPATAPVAAPTAPKPQTVAPDPPRPVIKPNQPQPVRTQNPAPVATLVTATPDPVQIIHTKRASDKDRMFLFSQLAKQLKVGIGPAESLDNLKARVPKYMVDSLDDASKHAMAGKPMSDAFEKYPDLYPEHVVGTIRAAEAGGFLPEACDLISDQAMNAHSFARWFWWVRPMVINAVIAIPLALLFMRGLIAAWDSVEGQGEGATAASTHGALGQGVLKILIWPVGPATLALWLILIGLTKWLRSGPATRIRHEITFRWPLFGKRAKHECLSVFSWVMSKVANAGVSPNRAWQLAANSVPNLAIKERLLRIGNGMGGAEKLSDAVFKEKLFPDEYAPVIAVAEHTGDMPGAFDQLFKISQVEFDSSQTYARDRSARWGCAFSMAVSGIILIILTYYFYNVFFNHVLSGLDQ